MIFGKTKTPAKKVVEQVRETDTQTRAVEIVYCSDLTLMASDFNKAPAEVKAVAKAMAKDMIVNLELRLETLRRLSEA